MVGYAIEGFDAGGDRVSPESICRVAHKNVENPQRMQQIHASITGADRVAPDP